MRTITVAASDASSDEKAMADFQCDGVEDNVEIQAAVNTVGATTVQLSAGHFNLNRQEEV